MVNSNLASTTTVNKQPNYQADRTVTLTIDDISYQIFLPNIDSDYIQEQISTSEQPYDLPMLEDMRKRITADELILDIGAHIGNYTLYLVATTGCQIEAFEPNKNLVRALQTNITLNHWHKYIAIHNIKLAENDTPITTLDSLKLKQPVKLLRIGVKSMEFAILRGGKTLLRRDRPILYIECQKKDDFISIVDWLAKLDYGYWDTFNTTPTHLFLPNEHTDDRHRIDHLQRQVVDNIYNSKHRLGDIHCKYHPTQGGTILGKNKPTFTQENVIATQHLKQQHQQLKFEHQELHTRVKKLTNKYDALEKQLSSIRASRTYRISNKLRIVIAPVRRWVSLPLTLWRLYKQVLQKRAHATHLKQQQNNEERTTQSITLPLLTDEQPPLPSFKENIVQAKALQIGHSNNNLKVACITDDFTYQCFAPECQLYPLSPDNWEEELTTGSPDMLLVESAWLGKEGLWRRKVNYISDQLRGIIAWCKERSIPTVFWNKEDPIHFQTFLNTAKLFDHVFSTDFDCIHRYKNALQHNRVYFLPFACQPTLHNPIEWYNRVDVVSFAGAYYKRYTERTRDLNNLLAGLLHYKPIVIYDRNYGKDDPDYQFPEQYRPLIVGTLAFSQIAQAYKGYRYAINMNSIKQSQGMCARRVFELLASNTVTISNFSRGLSLILGDLVIRSDNGEQVCQRLQELTNDTELLNKHKLAALRKVMLEHTYCKRLQYICDKVDSRSTLPVNTLPLINVLAKAATQIEADQLIEQFATQTYTNKQLFLVISDTINRDDNTHIHYLTDKDVQHKTISSVIDNADWVTSWYTTDYYGPNYLTDIAIATRYSCADLIGKAAYFTNDDQNIVLHRASMRYQPITHLMARQAAYKAQLIAKETFKTWLDALVDKQISSEHGLAIDPYNYCRNQQPSSLAAIKARVDDLSNLYTGLDINQLQSWAEQITPKKYDQFNKTITPLETHRHKYWFSRKLPILSFIVKQIKLISSGKPDTRDTNEKKMFTPLQLATWFNHHPSQYLDLNVGRSTLAVRSHLADNQHKYIYAQQELKPDLLTQNGKIQCYLDATPGLTISLTILFLNAKKRRIGHTTHQANRNITAIVPSKTAWLRLGLRIFSSGETNINGLTIGHRDLQSTALIGQSKYLLITNHYPRYFNLYRNAFIHSRVKAYADYGIKVDVFCLQENISLNFSEFENIDITTGNLQALQKVLSSNQYQSILVHFLNTGMWSILKCYVDYTRIIIWIHGCDIQSFYRREFLYKTAIEKKRAKKHSDRRMNLWHSVLQSIPKNLQLIFVSRYLLKTSTQDLDIKLPAEQVHIVHNAIDTKTFNYYRKPAEQRKKILSIRPYASAIYANDLSVEAIQLLARQPFFNELEFRLIGDGILFEEILLPLQKFSNVHIERKFLTHREIAKLHQQYGVFLVPTRMDSHGVSRDEAMSSGLVPITNAVAAIPEFVDKNCGILAPPEDAQAIANGIIELYNNPEKFQKMSASAAARVRKQSKQPDVIQQEIKIFTKSAKS